MKNTIVSITIAASAAWFTLAATADAGGYGRTPTSYGKSTGGYTRPTATFSTPAYPYHGAASLRSAYSQARTPVYSRSNRPTLSKRYSTGISRYSTKRR